MVWRRRAAGTGESLGGRYDRRKKGEDDDIKIVADLARYPLLAGDRCWRLVECDVVIAINQRPISQEGRKKETGNER